MITKQIKVNGIDFRVTLTDQVINQVNHLKNLYTTPYEDPESYDQVSAEISNAINEIAAAVEPKASDSDLDGLIQEIIKVVDNKEAEMEQELSSQSKRSKTTTKKQKKSRKK